MGWLELPFFEDAHRALAGKALTWAQARTPASEENVAAAVRELVGSMGGAGILRNVVAAPYGTSERLDVRSLCIIREMLAYHDGLFDFAFAMEGLGSGPISLFGNDDQRSRYLGRVADGSAVCALAVSEADAGSDVAALATTATRDGGEWVLDGEKTWISNAGVADFYVVFARTGEGPRHRGISAFIVDADAPGLAVSGDIPVTAPHPLGTITFDNCRVDAGQLIGAPGDGFKIAMTTLDTFRTTVGAAALGFARRALDEAVARVRERRVFDQALADFQITQDRIADMATEVDASALLIYRAAWTKDNGAERITSEAAMAKMYATEAAQRVIDRAVQLFGGLGVVRGNVVESLYREIRPLRIYEGTTEIQKLIIAKEILKP